MKSRDEAENYIKVNYKLEFQAKTKTDNFKRLHLSSGEEKINIIEKA
jgi:hypothetical protein